MAEQGSYPLNGRVLAGSDTLTGVVTNQTADVPLSALTAFILGSNGVLSGPTSSRPAPTFVGQPFFDTTLGFMVWAKQILPAIWVAASGVSV